MKEGKKVKAKKVTLHPHVKATALAALRGGAYRKTVGTLYEKGEGEPAYCVLGLLGHVAGVKVEKGPREFGLEKGTLGPRQQHKVFDGSSADIADAQEDLYSKNDDGWSFKKLADYIEKNY